MKQNRQVFVLHKNAPLYIPV